MRMATSCTRLTRSRQQPRRLQKLPKAQRGAGPAWSSTRTKKNDCATSEDEEKGGGGAEEKLSRRQLHSLDSAPPPPLSSSRRGEEQGKEHQGRHVVTEAAATTVIRARQCWHSGKAVCKGPSQAQSLTLGALQPSSRRRWAQVPGVALGPVEFCGR